jgi:hypothetical protein
LQVCLFHVGDNSRVRGERICTEEFFRMDMEERSLVQNSRASVEKPLHSISID